MCVCVYIYIYIHTHTDDKIEDGLIVRPEPGSPGPDLEMLL